jgi:anaerobic selenocysteine-containing dehydrogenase
LPVSLFEAAAVHTLNLLAGSVGRPGGVFLETLSGYGIGSKAVLDGVAEKGLSQARLDGAFSSAYPRTGNLAQNLFAQAARKDPYPINVLLINEANPAFSPSEAAFRRALEHIPLIVSFSSFLDETSALADFILPAPTFLERWDDSYSSLGVPFPVYGVARPVLPPVYQTRSTGDVFIALAKALGGSVAESLAFENMEAVIKQTAKGVFEAKKGRLADGPVPEREKYASASFESFDKFWEQLLVQGAWYHLENRNEEGKGKAEFPLSLLQPVQGKALPAEEHAGYPLTLVPTSLLLLQSGYWANPPFLTKYLGEETLKHNHLVVQINPLTARNLAVGQGEIVEIKSARGKIRAQLHLFEGAMPDVLFAPLGMGHQAFDATQKNRGANLYPLLDTHLDPLTGLEVSGPTRVKIQKG